MELNYKINNKDLTIYLYGELDECSAEKTRKQIDNLLEKFLNSNSVIFDLSGVTFMDSTGVGLLIGRYKKLKALNINTYITGATFSTEKVIQLSGLYSIMPKY